MIQYEVNLEILKEIYKEFLVWLNEHIKEILNIDGFENASIFENLDLDSSALIKITIRYNLISLDHLNEYFSKYSTIMRNKTIQKFGDKVKAQRKVLKLIDTVIK